MLRLTIAKDNFRDQFNLSKIHLKYKTVSGLNITYCLIIISYDLS